MHAFSITKKLDFKYCFQKPNHGQYLSTNSMSSYNFEGINIYCVEKLYDVIS